MPLEINSKIITVHRQDTQTPLPIEEQLKKKRRLTPADPYGVAFFVSM